MGIIGIGFGGASLSRRLAAAAASGVLAATVLPAAAFAADSAPSAGGQIDAGNTDVYVQLANSGEVPESSDNLRFSIPSEIDFAVKSDGTLVGPSTYMENGSVFAIHASALAVQAQDGWNIVDDAAQASVLERNQIDFQIGPAADMRNASDHLTKASMGDMTAWNMKAKGSGDAASQVQLKTSGHVNNVDKQIVDKAKVATLTWYVTPGEAS